MQFFLVLLVTLYIIVTVTTVAGLLFRKEVCFASKVKVSVFVLCHKIEGDGTPKPRNFGKRHDKIVRTSGGVPCEPVQAQRPSLYKPIIRRAHGSGGSKGKRIMSQGKPREQDIINPNRLRIIGGSAKGKRIDSPDVYLRPMMAKVREALFSTLVFMEMFQGNNTKVLDMFAGSGSIGLEALSRGANHATFVDLSPNCIDTALRNAGKCGFAGQVSAVCADVEEVLIRPDRFGLEGPYGLVSITPPYEEVIYSRLLAALCESPLVDQDTVVVIEYPVEMGALPHVLGNEQLFGIRNRRYGRTILGLYMYRPSKIVHMRPDEFM